VRFAVARQEGLTEELAGAVGDDVQSSALTEREKAAVSFADEFLATSGPASPALRARLLDAGFTDAGITELAAGMALYHGFSKLLIVLGLEPEAMDPTVLPTPDVPRRR
jgi:alkylhydroperoxidase family enzyme